MILEGWGWHSWLSLEAGDEGEASTCGTASCCSSREGKSSSHKSSGHASKYWLRLEQIRTCPCPGFSLLVWNMCRLVRQYDTLFMGLIVYMIGVYLICLEKSIPQKLGFQQVQHVCVKCQSDQKEHQKWLVQRGNWMMKENNPLKNCNNNYIYNN